MFYENRKLFVQLKELTPCKLPELLFKPTAYQIIKHNYDINRYCRLFLIRVGVLPSFVYYFVCV